MSEEQIILPERFKRVEYLESSGTQWIDTGVIPNNETGAYIKALQITTGNTFPMGAGSNNSGWVPMRLLMKGNGSYPTYRWGTSWSDSPSSFNDNIIYTSEFNWLNDKSVNLFRGEELIITKTLNSSTNINPGCTAAIFAVNNNTGSINYQWKGRVYEVKISQGEEIIKHFIPCLDEDNVPCMYEIIEGKAYYNKGSGDFLYNLGLENVQIGILHKLPEGFKKVKYLTANGSQYIDTNYVPTNETGYYIECQSYQTDTNWRPVFGLFQRDITNSPRIYLFTNPYPCIGWITTASALTSSSIYSKEKLKSEFNFLNSRKMTVSVNQNKLTYDLSDLTFTPTKSLYLFSVNDSNSTTLASGGSMCGRIDTFLISEEDQIVRQFVPCLDADGIPCMYELYTGTAHYNQGSGQFSYPIDYPSTNYNLPAGFKKCVYLQSDGTQWIDTGVIPNNETGLYFKALQLSYGNFMPFCINEGSDWIYPPRFSNKNLYYRWGSSAIQMMTWDKAGDLIFHSSLNLYNSKIAKFDSEDTDVVSYITSQTGTYTLPIWLFSCNVKGSYNATNGAWAGRIYRAQITQGDALIHDYVPCLDANGRPCMYDIVGGGTVEDNTYYNQSGGTEFTYCVEHQLPSDFAKLKYLESTGTQYIKTGHVPTNTTGLYIDTQDVGSGDTIPMGSWNSTSTNTRFFITRQTSSKTAGYGWGAWNQISSTTGSVRYSSTLNWLNDRKSITNNPLFVTVIKNLSDLSFTPQYDIWMFGINQGGSHAYKFKGRIYRAKISEGSEIVRDFVPAYDDLKQKPCMYDLINNVAYYNDGTGEFLHNRDFEGTFKGYTGLGCIGNRLGGDYNPINEKLPSGYTRVEFIESTGTQWMNTNYVPTTYSGVYVKYQATENSKSKYASWPVMSFDDADHGIAPLTNRYGTSAAWYWEIKLDPSYWNDHKSTDYIWESTMNFYDDGITSMKVIKNGNFTQSFKMGSWGSSVRRFEYIPTDPFRICYVKWSNKGVVPWIIYNVKITEGTELKRDYIPVIDSSGTPCMYDLVTKMPLHNSGSGKFVAGLKTLSNALQLKLSNNGGTITISLPTNDNIEYYEEKIRNNNPNWTITFQYH